jgi:hypothetical protein
MQHRRHSGYDNAEVAGRVGQLIGWLQIIFAPIVLYDLLRRSWFHGHAIPLTLVYVGLQLYVFMTLVRRGKELERSSSNTQSVKSALVSCVVATGISAITSISVLGLTLMYLAFIAQLVYTYQTRGP